MRVIIVMLTVLGLIISCGTNQQSEYKGPLPSPAMNDHAQTDIKTIDKAEHSIDRKVIKEGEISFETANINETKSLITTTVQELNGYIANDNISDFADRLEHRLVIRIPADKFDVLLKKISESAVKLDRKNINVLDVTEEFIDIDARIKTKKDLEYRYKEILKKAAKVEEIMNIEKEIGQLQTEIESYEGRMNYLKDKISFSTLTTIYYQKTTSAFRFSTKFGEALKGGWDGFLWFLIALTHLWIFIILGLVAVFLVIRRKKNPTKTGT